MEIDVEIKDSNGDLLFHKLKPFDTLDQAITNPVCGCERYTLTIGLFVEDWDDVTCKNCLKKRPE